MGGRIGGGLVGGGGDVSAIQSDSGDGEKGTITKITLPVSEIYANSVYSQR